MLVCIAAGACTSTFTVAPVTPRPLPVTGTAQAGAATVDITPATGLPLFGYSRGGAKSARGYWSRLWARVLVLDDGQGQRLALVQVDLGAASDLLRRLIATKTAELGIGPAQMLLFATHTHAGPGGYLGDAFYNEWGAGRPGFFEDLVRWQAEQIADCVARAVQNLRPAAIASVATEIDGLSRNRSLQAWKRNFPCGEEPYRFGIRPRLVVLRVDAAGDAGTPIAALVLFALHNTAASAQTDLYHGDLQSVAAATLMHSVEDLHGAAGAGFVALVGSQAQGDVSPSWTGKSFDEVVRLGSSLGSAAFAAWKGIPPEALAGDFTLDIRYAERRLPGAVVGPDEALCRRARAGAAVVGGADDGRYTGFLGYGLLRHAEGLPRRWPRGCHTYKPAAMGIIQRLLLQKEDFPQMVPIHGIRIGDSLVLASVAGEPTTEVGRRIEAAVSQALDGPGEPIVVALSHANTYTSYVTTPAEYEAQHYEGASTLYGPHAARFWETGLRELFARDEPSIFEGEQREFRVSGRRRYLPAGGKCAPENWGWGSAKVVSEGQFVKLVWMAPGHTDWCAPPPVVRVECETDSGGWAKTADDDGNGVTVRHLDNQGRWEAAWVPQVAGGRCRFVVEHAGETQFQSAPHPVRGKPRGKAERAR